MKMSKKQFAASLLLASCMISGIQNHAFASDIRQPEIVEPLYVGVISRSCVLSISSGVATCKGTVNLKSNYSANLTMKLQRSANGTSWTTLQTWSGTGTSLTKSRSISSGYKYRCTFNIKVYNSSGTLVDNITATSAIKSY